MSDNTDDGVRSSTDCRLGDGGVSVADGASVDSATAATATALVVSPAVEACTGQNQEEDESKHADLNTSTQCPAAGVGSEAQAALVLRIAELERVLLGADDRVDALEAELAALELAAANANTSQ